MPKLQARVCEGAMRGCHAQAVSAGMPPSIRLRPFAERTPTAEIPLITLSLYHFITLARLGHRRSRRDRFFCRQQHDLPRVPCPSCKRGHAPVNSPPPVR